MIVKIADKIYDSNEEPIMIILDESDKENIKNIDVYHARYCSFPTGKYTTEEIDKFMETKK